MIMRGSLMLAVLILIAPELAASTTYLVRPDGSGDFPDIQAAIFACEHGDVVELADGLYTGPGNRDLTNHETEVLIRSQSGQPAACVIDCQGSQSDPHRFATLVITGEQGRAVWGLRNLTIVGGWAGTGGAVIVADWATPEITGCIFRDNHADEYGGAVFGAVGLPLIADCWFEGNSSTRGGAISGLDHCRFQVSGCTFLANQADEGGAVYSSYDTGSSFTGCTFVANSAALGCGLDLHAVQPMALDRCLVANGEGGAAINLASGSIVTLTCCDLFDNAGGNWIGAIADQLPLAGNICADPFLCDPAAGDLHLHADSPCAPGTPPNPQCDLIGAWPVGCGPIGTTQASWGGVKALFR
jgi:predicted outer membrane repeat protein